MSTPQRHHLVLKGCQKNFADSQQRLTVIDSASGAIIERLRPARRNWVENDWNTFWDESGDPNRRLEQEFARIETSVVRRIRELQPEAITQINSALSSTSLRSTWFARAASLTYCDTYAQLRCQDSSISS